MIGKRMKRAARGALSLVLATQLALPGMLAAAPERRDLQVEGLVQELREGAALWVLAVGVSNYQDPRISLQYADNDAVSIAKMLKSQQGLLFREVFTHVLVNEYATREAILDAMSRFLGQAAANDVVLIFMAGHGLQDRQTGTYYFVPYNATADNLVYAGLPMPMFEEACKRLQTNVSKLIFWLDTCHSGAVSVAARGVSVGEDLAQALKQAEGQYWLSASKAGEESYEDESYRLEGERRAHGAFTYSILRGLEGGAADAQGVVWISDLFTHVSKEVPRMTTGRQHPHWQLSGTNLPLFVVNEQSLAAVSQASVASDFAPGPLGPAPAAARGGSKKWLYLL
ncbi:MAG: caspase family protein, partial [Gemmatimonadota bacterium]